MKKLLYISILAFICVLSVSSCTEEQVIPTRGDNGGGAGADPIRKEL